MNKTKVFIETTIQIRRLLGGTAEQQRIEALLTDKYVITSAYVFMEFRRTILQDFSLMRSIAQQMDEEGFESVSFSDILREIANARTVLSSRVLRRLLLVISSLAEHFVSEAVPSKELIKFLSFQINYLAYEGFFDIIDEVVNYIDCDLVKVTAILGDRISSRLSCNATKVQCQLVPFLSAHREELCNIETAIANAAPEIKDTQALAALQRINADVSLALGERTCWAIGDVIIALEAPADALIFSDDLHFEVICDGLKKQRFIP
jgi:hypothetical protein